MEALLLITIFLSFFIIGMFMSFRFNYDKADGTALFVCAIVCAVGLFIVEAHYLLNSKPTAMDVYRGNTTLKITSVDGIPTDSVVVFKDRN